LEELLRVVLDTRALRKAEKKAETDDIKKKVEGDETY
jgi:hypothetical protein